MANSSQWFQTDMPQELVDIICKDVTQFDGELDTAVTYGGVQLEQRDSKTGWIPHNHWVVGLCWHYVMLANERNFCYDIGGFEMEGGLQYTSYDPGEYYNWHVDGDINNHSPDAGNVRDNFINRNSEKVRKLSFILQLSSHEDYTGGEVQLQYTSHRTQFMPKTRGTVIVFDSRTLHRVKAVKTGNRKSLVGWVWGPRWK
jgi:PKHD-type hydroxylase|tara:strand:+ start:34 stop:633 length:600 start_codon:yes stop_codon:yes gene_type:complete